MERKQKKKVVRLNKNPIKNKEEVDDGGDHELSYMDKLPPEILTEILDYLDESQLVKCRLLSSRWNEICCLLLQNKTKNNPESKLVVQIRPIRGESYSLECTTVITEPLEDFLECFSLSDVGTSKVRRRPFPFSCFKIAGLYLENRHLMDLFVPFLRYIKSLVLEVTNKETKDFNTFWRLVLKFAPNIQHLGLAGTRWCEMDLFEPYFNFKANSDPFEIDGDQIQNQEITFLSKLKTMEIILEDFDSMTRGDVKTALSQLLENSPNLQELIFNPSPRAKKSFVSMFGPFHFLKVWQPLNRAHLLKTLEIKNPMDGSKSLSPAQLMTNLQLESLIADCDVEKSTIKYIYHALKSSQNTLSKLNLYNLTMKSMNVCFREIKSLPNVRQLQLQIQNAMENGEILEKFSQLCPNVQNLNLGRLHGDFSQVARIIWTGFKGLKSLKLEIDMTNEQNNLLAVDTGFSGYSQESIERIQSKLEEGIFLEEARRGEPQQNPSILDLKDLSRLQLQFNMGQLTNEKEQMENQIVNSVFVQMLPQHIQEYPRSILCHYFG